MEKRLYAGNLNYKVRKEDLESLFAQVGKVESAVVITDKATGRSKGFGFVEMSTDAEATAAIDKFHDTDFHGRKLLVNRAQPPRKDN
jgi:RNA recognition motif-containing protein